MVNERMKLMRNSFGLSQNALGDKLGITQTTYANYESGKANVPDSVKQNLANLGVNLHWLITGEGSMFKDKSDTTNLMAHQPKPTYMSVKGSIMTEEIPDGGLSVPILTQRLSAGPGQPWTHDDFIDSERLPILARFIKPWKKENIFAAEVRGDSMTGIQLFDGDMAFFARGEVEGDGIYVITVDDEVYIKRVAFNPFDKKITIKSENDRYEPIIVDADRVTLVGKVIGWLHHHPY